MFLHFRSYNFELLRLAQFCTRACTAHAHEVGGQWKACAEAVVAPLPVLGHANDSCDSTQKLVPLQVADKDPVQGTEVSTYCRHAPLCILYMKTRQLASRCLSPERQDHSAASDRCKAVKSVLKSDTIPTVSAKQVLALSSATETVTVLHQLTLHNYIRTNPNSAAFTNAKSVRVLDGKQLDGLFGIQGAGTGQTKSVIDTYTQKQLFPYPELDHESSFVSRPNCHMLQAAPSSFHHREITKQADGAAKDTGRLYMTSQDEQPTEGSQKKTSNQHNNRASPDQLHLMRDHLVETFPQILRSVHNYNIYNVDLVFQNNFSKRPKTYVGVHKWALQIAKARFYMRSKYASVEIQILKATVNEEKGTILVHWRCKAVPQFRVLMLWKFLPWKYKKTVDSESEWIEGLSTYYLGGDNLFYKIRLDRTMEDRSVDPATSPLPGMAGLVT